MTDLRLLVDASKPTEPASPQEPDTQRTTSGEEDSPGLGAGDNISAEGAPAEDGAAEDATVSVVRAAQRAIDAIHVDIGGRWRRTVRATASLTSALLALAVVYLTHTKEPASIVLAFVIIAFMFGGFFAWFSRDVVAAIERLRR
jgi:hypothetical protein